MADRRLERVTVPDNRLFFYEYPLHGFSLKFVSGPKITKDILPGSWLDVWDIVEEKRRFSFSPRNHLAFPSKETAEAVQAELKQAVDIITEVVEA